MFHDLLIQRHVSRCYDYPGGESLTLSQHGRADYVAVGPDTGAVSLTVPSL